MKHLYIIVVSFLTIYSLGAVEPQLPAKDLSVNKKLKNYELKASEGYVHALDFKNLSIDTASGFTVELKARLNDTTARGIDFEARNGARKGFRFSAGKKGIVSLTNGTALYVSDSTAVSDSMHIYRFASKGNQVHVYLDGVYQGSSSLSLLEKEELLTRYNPGFEEPDLSMWLLADGQPGITSSNGEFRNGTKAMKLVSNDQSAVAAFTVKGLKPATEYGFTFWTKGIVMGGNMRFQITQGYFDTAGEFVQNSTSEWNEIKPATTAWRMYGKSFTTAQSDDVVVIRFLGWNSSNTIVIDDLGLIENESTPVVGNPKGPNLIANSTFSSNIDGWPATGLGWPLGTAQWSSTNGGQLQVKEGAWGNNYDGAYSVTVPVTPGSTYKLSAKTSQFITPPAGTYRYIRLVDGAAKVEKSYSPSGGLSSYLTTTTPPLTVGNTSTAVTMQFTTKTQHNSATAAKVVMTLDDVVLQEYEAVFPSFISLGKLSGQGAMSLDIEYMNYDITGAYAPGVVDPNKQLWDSIEVAEVRLSSVPIGNIPGKYPQSAFDMYSTAIQTARSQATQTLTSGQLELAIQTLTEAGVSFLNSKIKGDYYPEKADLQVWQPVIEAGEASSTQLSVTMNDAQELDWNFIKLHYTSLTPEIVEVNSYGTLIGKAPGIGKMEVSVSYEGRSVSDTVQVTVVALNSFKTSDFTDQVLIGDTIKLNINAVYTDGSPVVDPNYVIYSSDRDVIMPGYDGNLYATGEGEALLRVWVRRDKQELSGQFLLKVVSSATDVDITNPEVLKIFTDPAGEHLVISNLPANYHQMDLYSISGQKIKHQPVFEGETIDVSNLPQGVFVLVLSGDHQPLIKNKVLIVR